MHQDCEPRPCSRSQTAQRSGWHQRRPVGAGHGGRGRAARPVGLRRVEQVVRADGARAQVAALVPRELGQVHAGVAVHAVARVHAQAAPAPAQVAEGAVVDGARRLVVPQVADAAVVARHRLPARAAGGRGRLARAAGHADHGGDRVRVQPVVGHLVVAEAARVHLPAARRDHVAAPLVVRAAEHAAGGVMVRARRAAARAIAGGAGAGQAALLRDDVSRGHDVLHQVRLALRGQARVAAHAPRRLLRAGAAPPPRRPGAGAEAGLGPGLERGPCAERRRRSAGGPSGAAAGAACALHGSMRALGAPAGC